MILKQAVKPFPFRLVCGKQAGATFEFCTFIRKPIKGLDNKLLLITLTFLEALIVTVIVHTCNKRILGKWTFPSDRCIEQVHKHTVKGRDRDIPSKIPNPMILEAGKIQVKHTTHCGQSHLLSVSSILY